MKRLILLILLLALLACNNQQAETHVEDAKINLPDTTGVSLNVLEQLHQRKTVKNKDRSLVEYIQKNPNKITDEKKVVYLLPFGVMKPEVEEILKEEVNYLKVFLQVEVKIMGRISFGEIKNLNSVKTRMVPDDDYAYYSDKKGWSPDLREQIEVNSFIDEVMMQRKPKDAVAVLGITEHDIYAPKYNYLFGSSRTKQGLGMVSVFRLIDYGETTRDNIRKVVSKQILNMFSIHNVKDYLCLMNFHNNISQLIEGRFVLSQKALEKLKYAVGFDYVKRFEELKTLWEEEGYQVQAAYYQKCIDLINGNEVNESANVEEALDATE